MKTLSFLLIAISLIAFSCDSETTSPGKDLNNVNAFPAKAVKSKPGNSDEVVRTEKPVKAGSIDTDSSIFKQAREAKSKMAD